MNVQGLQLLPTTSPLVIASIAVQNHKTDSLNLRGEGKITSPELLHHRIRKVRTPELSHLPVGHGDSPVRCGKDESADGKLLNGSSEELLLDEEASLCLHHFVDVSPARNELGRFRGVRSCGVSPAITHATHAYAVTVPVSSRRAHASPRNHK